MSLSLSLNIPLLLYGPYFEPENDWSPQFFKSAALPAPIPYCFVGVFTLTKIISASFIAWVTFDVKKRLRPRVAFITSSKPGSYLFYYYLN